MLATINRIKERKAERATALIAAPQLVKDVMIARFVYELTDAEICAAFQISHRALRNVDEFLREFVALHV